MLHKLTPGRSVSFRLGLSLALLAIICLLPGTAQAKWPPFSFSLDGAYDNGRIIYKLNFEADADWDMTNVTIKVPLPAGTSFVEANAQETTQVSFDGGEVVFFTPDGSEAIRVASFTVEVTQPEQKIFTTQPWIGWQGAQPGDYLFEPQAVDIGKPPLPWPGYAAPRLHLEARAISSPGQVIYEVYLLPLTRARVWDVKVNVPVPAGATFVDAEAPPGFGTSYDGREVYYSASEVSRNVPYGPLRFTVNTSESAEPLTITHAWASWKNAGRNVARSQELQEEGLTGDLIVRTNTNETVVADPIGDVALKNYDVTSVALSQAGPLLYATFYLVGDLSGTSDPIDYTFNIDTDCNSRTGKRAGTVGAEYQVVYRLGRPATTVNTWDAAAGGWQKGEGIALAQPARGNAVTLPIAARMLGSGGQFCWSAEVANRTKSYLTAPPQEVVPRDAILDLVRFSFTPTDEPVPVAAPSAPAAGNGQVIKNGDTWRYQPGWTEAAAGWTGVGFDDREWLSGPSPLGYGRNYATNLEQVMVMPEAGLGQPQETVSQAGTIISLAPPPEADSLFARRAFEVPDPAAVKNINLRLNVIGGFVAYLNGVEVGRANLGDEPGSPVAYDTPATQRLKRQTYTLDLAPFISNLAAGTNVLAIQLHRANGDEALALNARLTIRGEKSQPVVGVAPVVELADAEETSLNLPAQPTPLSGKLALPLDNGAGFYDVYIFSVPDGHEIGRIHYARQPNFSPDGQRLLINKEGSGEENVYEYNVADQTQRQVSEAPQDWHPFYHPGGGRIVYGNDELTVGSPELVLNDDGEWVRRPVRKPYIFVQCNVQLPHDETEARCRDIPNLGVLVPAGQMGEIQGTRPVWTANDTIAFSGCNSWSGFGKCGIYSVPSASTKGFSDGFIPRQLTTTQDDFPTDSKGNLIAFTSNRDGNWEVNVMDLSGNGLANVSNSPASADGLGTLSPDLYWTAFISDRDGRWAVWVAPTAGGPAQKLFDLPRDVPFAADDRRSWQNERISWAP